MPVLLASEELLPWDKSDVQGAATNNPSPLSESLHPGQTRAPTRIGLFHWSRFKYSPLYASRSPSQETPVSKDFTSLLNIFGLASRRHVSSIEQTCHNAKEHRKTPTKTQVP